MEEHQTVTEMLTASRKGSRAALDRLFAQLYEELRRIAHRQLGSEAGAGTLNTTAVINEAWLRLVDQTQVEWEDRARFLGYASQTMRGIVVDHARRRRAHKRGGVSRTSRSRTGICRSRRRPTSSSRSMRRSAGWRRSVSA
jgi:RNA polymerase sigma factor (TIGR02999 family)